ncbi:heparin-sulfate lyase HepC [Flavobacterium seoulense]|uniref:Uncharacterized protein n=1 Tax=Flavobacterium seoulense TaxID=1492738 RepID=A0A066WYD0_9FLAO|nr:heparin-sulfate lyase HepC [Flavobacterium seoulense]KDN55685.1 hypothetical protein FEM21_12870 [Flavobacterium seoulense]
MKNLKTTTLFSFLLLIVFLSNAQEKPITKTSFNNINLSYPGLEKVNTLFTAAKYNEAANELLNYYRNRKNIKHPDFNTGDEARFRGKDIGKANQLKADNALLHQFQPQKGYGYYDYGKDINWEFWPVKDNEVRWQLHRVTWWQPMGMAYRSSGDEKYAKEWIFQFRDWAKKNALGLSKENDRYAWRPLEVSSRLENLPGTFNLFVNSPNFTPDFLLDFLNCYAQQADYIPKNYSAEGNHLLFEAEHLLGAGAFFPELKSADDWRKSGIEVLNREIIKQVYADGIQWELSPAYQVATIDIFLRAYQSAKLSGLASEFPESYIKTIENMVVATANSSFPDYRTPMFGDSWIVEKQVRIKRFQNWSKTFPDNQLIKYFATDGKQGNIADYLSNASKNSGFYTFRNGWDQKATVMLLKASPPGKFHAQPDNGTFELWVKGRNFTPDAGAYVYSGDAAINQMREWYRQTKLHSTLTLDNKNMVITDAKLNKWQTGKDLDILTYTNPSYDGLNHQRSVLFINQKYFLIIDKAIGNATGQLGVHFPLIEDSKPVFDQKEKRVYTTFADGNNLLIQSLNTDNIKLIEEESKVSYQYMKELNRPAFAFEKPKSNNQTQQFISILYPYEGTIAPKISIKENSGNDFEKGNINLTLTIDGQKTKVKTNL